MGKMIYDNAHTINATVTDIFDPNIAEYSSSMTSVDFSKIDVAIEFTHPSACYENICTLLKKGVPVVSGTTGWFHRLSELATEVDSTSRTLIYGANFSVGMNLFYHIVENTAKLINKSALYDVYGLEKHHNKKADSPSGTAKVIADILLKQMDEKDSAVFELNNRSIQKNEVCISSVRAGAIVGYHEVGFDSDFDAITLTHDVKNRKGFVMGALLSAKYATSCKGFYDFKDIFHKVIGLTM
jgi:4-hydroxy-tetrahydrodipicolinate reductase